MKREPAFWIGVIASAILAVLNVLAGNDLLSGDFVNWVRLAIDPTQNGWLLPVLLGLVTRFFVSPAEHPGF